MINPHLVIFNKKSYLSPLRAHAARWTTNPEVRPKNQPYQKEKECEEFLDKFCKKREGGGLFLVPMNRGCYYYS